MQFRNTLVSVNRFKKYVNQNFIEALHDNFRYWALFYNMVDFSKMPHIRKPDFDRSYT